MRELLFQSTLPRGERRGGMRARAARTVSIHAPARGATGWLALEKGKFGFQSTLPRGERPVRRTSSSRGARFNPRSREGSDAHRRIHYAHSNVSIHAPARGATDALSRQMVFLTFQSTLPRGERHEYAALKAQAKFQSTLPRGERLPARARALQRRQVSIHAPARGATAAG